MLYALRAMVKTASFSQESAISSRHCAFTWLYNSCPSNDAKSTPVSCVSNIDEPVFDQISSKSDVKSTDNIPNDVLSLFVLVLLLDDVDRPANKSSISDNICAAALVSLLIAASPSVALYIAETSSALNSTAAKLLSSNCANIVSAWSIAFSVLRMSVYFALQMHLRYVSLALAQN